MMKTFFGIDLDDLALPIKEGVRRAAELSFNAIELSAAGVEIAPDNLSASGRRHFSRLVAGLGLNLSALTADFPGLRLSDPVTSHEQIERTGAILELARALGASTVTASVGAMTHPETGEPSPLSMEGLRRIGERADALGVVYAIRPSRDGGDRIARVLDELRCPAIRVGLDPASMVMAGVNPLSFVERFMDQVSLFHARDATVGLPDRPGQETRLGEGEVDLEGVVSILQAAEYAGPHIIRRRNSSRPQADLVAGRDLLMRLLRDA